MRPTWLQIDLDALEANFRRVRELVAPRRVWCVVKGNAYGHGAIECARRLQSAGADAFAVATVDEGVELRWAGISGRILVMTGIEPVAAPESRAAARQAAEHRLEIAVWRPEAARALAAAVVGDPVAVHLKVDTGMGRLGVLAGEDTGEVLRVAAEIAAIAGVRLEGLFSNLAAADAAAGHPGYEHAKLQAQRFERLCVELDERGLLPPERHLSNSAAVLLHPESWRPAWCNGVRPGLLLVGVSPTAADVTFELDPVMSWHSTVAAVRRVPRGWQLGYGAERPATRDSTIAVVPVGYHDGFPRALSDRAEALIGNRRARVVGAISMDLTLFDITGISAVRPGSPALLLGGGGDGGVPPIDANELAAWAGTIAHEVLCRVGSRVPLRFGNTTP